MSHGLLNLFELSFEALAYFHQRGVTGGFVNLSQSIERMGLALHMPCVTPRGEFYSLERERYLLGSTVPKLVLNCFKFTVKNIF